MKINGLWAHNGLSDKGYAYAEALTENEKRAKARRIKSYRGYEEYFPWQFINNEDIVFFVLFIVFFGMAVLGVMVRESKAAVGFFALSCLFLFFWLVKGNSIKKCIHLRNEKKLAKTNGKRCVGEIVGYKIKTDMLQFRFKGQDCADFSFTYVLEVRFAEGNRNRIIKTPDMRYHPNSVLKSNRCNVYRWNGKYYCADFDLRKKRTDEATAIPFQGVTYGKKW